MMKRIKQNKENAALLVRYANPKSKSKPTDEQVLEILYRHIPYCGTIRPIIKYFTVSRFNRNKIIKSAYFVVELDNGKSYEISAYQDLKGRTPEEKEADKTAEFPSGLFTIFHTEIKAQKKKTEQVTEQKEEDSKMKQYELIPADGRKSFYGKAVVDVEDNGAETLYSYGTAIVKRLVSGELVRLWDGWTATTGRHINAFCGLKKAAFMALPLKMPAKKPGPDMSPAESYRAMMGRRAAR